MTKSQSIPNWAEGIFPMAKYMGDGVRIYFGYPEAHEDDAERAVRAGLELITAVRKLEMEVPSASRSNRLKTTATGTSAIAPRHGSQLGVYYQGTTRTLQTTGANKLRKRP